MPSPPLTPYFATLLAKDRGLFPCCHGDVAWEKCKGRTGKSRGGGVCVQPSVLEPACLKTSQGREGEWEKRGKRGEFVQTPLPMGRCVSVLRCSCKTVWERLQERQSVCEFSNLRKNTKQRKKTKQTTVETIVFLYRNHCKFSYKWSLTHTFSIGVMVPLQSLVLIYQYKQLSAASVPL